MVKLFVIFSVVWFSLNLGKYL